MDNQEQHYISPAQLRVGIYVHLDLSWMRHPFALSSFKIKDEAQIRTIQAMDLSQIRYDPLRSDCEPLLPDSSEPPVSSEEAHRVNFVPSSLSESNTVIHKQRLAEINRAIAECEKDFLHATSMARQVLANIATNPQAAAAEAEVLVAGMVDSILTEGDVILHSMDGSRLGDATYCHPLNVTVLALIVAKSLDMSVEDARLLGLAALFHDAGKLLIPDSIRMNHGQLTMAEQAFMQRHVEYSAELVRKAGLPERVAQIVMQHHEFVDGSGYPVGLKGAQLDPLAKVLSLVNAYDKLCNTSDTAEAMTPYGALSHLFASQRKQHDGLVLNRFIKSLGVYPPGSIVMLNDGVYGVVISVNPEQLLRPIIMLHDRRVKRETPEILDLGEDADASISRCLRLDQLPKEVLDYLQCRRRLSYFFTTAEAGDGGHQPVAA